MALTGIPLSKLKTPRRFLLPLLLLFAGSGCAALIYEVVWFQMLELVIGSTAVSLAVLLGTFMGGMGLGNLILPRLVAVRRHPLRVYALLELGIALSAVIVWYGLPAAGRFYTQSSGLSHVDYLWRAAICVLFLLLPTMLMGATLPAMARWTQMTPQGVSWLGACYAINIVGAVVGSLLTGFYLLRVYDLAVASGCGLAINLGVALVALVLARSAPHGEKSSTAAWASADPVASRDRVGLVLVSIGFSGFCALVAQVIWTRLLALMLGGTVYTFSIILAVFLFGLGLGGLGGSALARREIHPNRALGLCQLLQVFLIVWADDLLTRTLPFWSGTPAAEVSLGSQFLSDLCRVSLAILPATMVWGASFPLALAAGSRGSSDPGRSVGMIYAANTAGAVLGAVLASLWLLPWLGTARIEGLLIAGSLVAALVLLRPKTKARRVVLAVAVGLAIWLGLNPSAVPWQVVAYGRHAAEGDQTARILYFGEGSQATVAVSENLIGTRYFHVSGKTEASTHYYDMRLQRMLGHLPALLHPRPRSVLIVGLGAGVTAGSFVLYPSVERIVICEIEPLIVRHVAGYFREENNRLLEDPRVQVVYDDARHFLATTREKFDIITSDPIHPWVKGAAKLYSAEYFTLCYQHLNSGGLVTQWVPFYSSSRDVVRSEIATFLNIFPEGTIWGNEEGGRGYDSVLLGSATSPGIDMDALQTRFARPDYIRVRQSLAEVHLGSVIDLLGTYAGRKRDLVTWLDGAEINQDRSLRLQYLAGLSVNSRAGAAAYKEMLSYRHFPEGLFRANESDLKPLWEKLRIPRSATGP